jgi:hypothetical protein
MQKLPLDPATLSVDSFEATTAQVETAARVSVETNDEICYCESRMPEDCFGPTAGCSTDHTEA